MMNVTEPRELDIVRKLNRFSFQGLCFTFIYLSFVRRVLVVRLEGAAEGGDEEDLDVIELLLVTVETGACTRPGKVDAVVGVGGCDRSVVVVVVDDFKSFINPKSAVSCCCMIF